MTINFNQTPYYDDFDETKKFVRILFNPSVAVQARELTQLQTMLQNQLGRFGKHVFTNGSKVLDAQSAFEPKAVSVKITATDIDLGANISNIFTYFSIDTDVVSLDYLKTIITKQGYLSNRDGVSGLTFTNGNARLKVVAVYPLIDINNPATIICQEMTGVVAANNTTYTATTGKSFTSAATLAVGGASFYSINSGVFFINDLFIYTGKQTVVAGKYTGTPTVRVGLDIVGEIITADTDKSLLDPARDSTNYNAVGADRYSVDLQLVTKAFDAVDPINNSSSIDYIELARITDGVISAQRETSTYSELEDSLARRTYDESGDYTVKPFDIQLRDHPTDTTLFQVGMGAGTAYVRGYEFRTISTNWLDVPRARTSTSTVNEVIPTLFGNYVLADSSTGTITGNLPVLTEDTIQLWNATTAGTQIGTAKVRMLYRTGSTTYRIYLTDVTITSGVFGDIRSIRYTGGVRWDLVVAGGKVTAYETATNSLLFKQAHDNVKTFTNATYNYVKVSSISAGQWSGSGPYTLTSLSPATGEVFAQSDTANGYAPYVIVDSTGVVRTITNVVISGGTATITISAGAGAPSNSTLYSLMARTNSTVRTKTLNTNSITATAGAGVTKFNLASGVRNFYDATSIVSIFHSAAPATDIKAKFKLDSGQTDNYYGLASITWIDAGAIPTTGTFAVTFKSFDHSNDGLGTGYFTIDSYTNVTVDQIPTHVSTATGMSYPLRDIIDFRPTISDTVGVSTFKNQALPVPYGIGAEFTADYQYYLGRIDKIILTKDRSFIDVTGIPAEQPIVPNNINDSMTLYILNIPPYTLSTKDVSIKYIENKRYTMRDVGKIDKRVERVEYYTSLSFLEKQAKDSALLTSAGVNAFKNGILVDSFSGHDVGDVGNTEYKCSIDYTDRVLRPKFDIRNVGFTRTSGGTLSSAGIVTLPYTTEAFIDQPLASSVVNVTPYDVVSWTGTVELSPASDTWHDIITAPDIIVNTDGRNNNWVAQGALAVGTVWDDWTSNWVGKPADVSNTTVTSDTVTWTTRATTTTTRTGLQTTIVGESFSNVVNNKVIDSSVIPFMRQITVAFSVKFMKPYTRIYTYFDDKAVNTGLTMTTDSLGSYSGTFTIPANVRTGSKLFFVSDKATLAEATLTSAATNFHASGTLDTVQSTRMRNFVLSSRQITETTSTTTVSNRIDPLAESFFVNASEYPNGVFIDSIDTYFFSKSATLPVMLQIRPMVNGYPSSIDILPFSEVTLNPSSVNIAVDPYAPKVTDRTNFKFSAPVHLPVGEYCFVLLSTTTEYQVYSAIMGEKQLGANNFITKQPYIGSSFKSQNASTWTASQEMDLMFRINKCVFDTSTYSDVLLTNTTTGSSEVFPYHVMNAFDCVQEFSSARATLAQKGMASGGSVLDTNWTDVNFCNNIFLKQENKVQFNLADQLQYRIRMQTTDKNVSPVVDLQRASALLVKNLINTDLTNETVAGTGLASAKYMTNKVTLATGFESTDLSVTFDAYLPSISDVYVYYKVASSGTATDLNNQNWILLGNSATAVQSEANRLDVSVPYKEYSLKTSVSLPLFNTYVIKLVMVGNGVNCPQVKDLRVIAFS